ncbi:MAG: XRE family transcriptional regulator [Methanocorpusculum sp.]|uniref:helix-turn-helix domain-containing protein n=1 Tax=Methanocorpusculum sp. TaxID=2058474 RepID=UPI002B21EA6C|nr:XRE family transcriptional regulator [Methanocorpusculum sp.]MEA5087104.1 XRE family transcriptional regulator [Methanocorpusculum sp.]
MFGERIKQARRLSAMSQQELADKMNVSKMTISKYENNKLYPTSGMLIALSEALNVGIDYFFRETSVVLTPDVAYRKSPHLTEKDLGEIMAKSTDVLERQKEIMNIMNITLLKVPGKHIRSISTWEEIEKLTLDLRKKWQLGLDPIENLMEVVENQGFCVGVIDAPKGFDAFTDVVDTDVPVIILQRNMPGDRQRFSLGHELGHFFIKNSGSLDVERMANQFAASLLVPREMLIRDLGERRTNISLDELCLLKHKYGASMQCLVYRMKDVGIIDISLMEEIILSFKRNGWDVKEPGDQIKPEEPMRMKLLVNRALSEGIISESKKRELLGEKISFEAECEAA